MFLIFTNLKILYKNHNLAITMKPMKLLNLTIFKEPFYIFTLTLLSLLFPLSFLIFSRLSCYNYLLTIKTIDPIELSPSFILSIFLYINPLIMYALVTIASLATLICGLSGKTVITSGTPSANHRPCLYFAWIVLSTLQTCVGLGIEGIIANEIDVCNFGDNNKYGFKFITRLLFFLGLHEGMLHWCRVIVKRVVDDTVYGVAREEKWVVRVAIALSLGGVWWWRLRDEAETLVAVVEAKGGDVGWVDFGGWWLYYLVVTIGVVRIFKGLVWVGSVLIRRRVRRSYCEFCEVQHKV